MKRASGANGSELVAVHPAEKLTDFVTLFLESKLAQVNGQVRKPKTYGDLVDRFKPLKAFVGSSTLDSLNENLLRRYYNHVLSLNLSGYRQKNLFKAFLSLTRWLSSEGYLDKMPCNLGGPWEFVEHLKDGQRQTPEKLASFLFTKDDVARCLTKLGPTGRACVLLGLNCGFTEADIAVLRKSQVNLTEGRLIYSRTKTVRVKNAPMINYRLWNVTIEALRAVESQSEDLWFLTSEGQPLKTSKIVEGRHVEWSVIAKSWQVWRESGKVPDKPFKMLRKTGDTIIGDSRYRAFTELYLADKPTSIAGKHYDIKEREGDLGTGQGHRLSRQGIGIELIRVGIAPRISETRLNRRWRGLRCWRPFRARRVGCAGFTQKQRKSATLRLGSRS